MTGNTFPFNTTGHPALTVPVGMVGGLPVGLMIVAKHFDEITALKIGHELEQVFLSIK